MPPQDLTQAPRAKLLAPEGTAPRRLIMIAGSLAIAALVGAALFHVLRRDGFSFMEGVALALTVLLSAWVGFGFSTISSMT